MSDAIEISQEDSRQGEALQRAIGKPTETTLDICGSWAIVKPYWSWILIIVAKVPRVGAAIAAALKFVGEFLDAHCKK